MSEDVVLLHGFGGSARSWEAVRKRLGVPALALDLPGHGTAMDRSDLSVGEARKFTIAELDRRGIERAHLVGHSRGGAIAFLVAVKAPERIASLTLLAPGGFGEEIAADALTRFAQARTAPKLRDAMNALYHPARPSSRVVEEEAVHREDVRAVPALQAICEAMTTNGRQVALKLELLRDAPFPIHIVWGGKDAVLPVAQAERARAALPNATVSVLADVGHMLPAEVPGRVADAIRTQFRANRSLPER